MHQFLSTDFPSRYPFFLLIKVYGVYTLEAETALKRVGLDVPAWRTLALLREFGPMSVSEIALNAVTKLSTVTRSVLRMKADGLVATTTSASDARVTVVTMTDTGRVALERADPVMQHIFARSFEGLTPTQTTRLNELLGLVLKNMSPRHLSGTAKKRNSAPPEAPAAPDALDAPAAPPTEPVPAPAPALAAPAAPSPPRPRSRKKSTP